MPNISLLKLLSCILLQFVTWPCVSPRSAVLSLRERRGVLRRRAGGRRSGDARTAGWPGRSLRAALLQNRNGGGQRRPPQPAAAPRQAAARSGDSNTKPSTTQTHRISSAPRSPSRQPARDAHAPSPPPGKVTFNGCLSLRAAERRAAGDRWGGLSELFGVFGVRRGACAAMNETREGLKARSARVRVWAHFVMRSGAAGDRWKARPRGQSLRGNDLD